MPERRHGNSRILATSVGVDVDRGGRTDGRCGKCGRRARATPCARCQEEAKLAAVDWAALAQDEGLLP